MALDFLRRHHQRKSLFLVIPLVLILLSFIAFYFPQATPAGSRGEQIGSVGDVPITLGEFQRAYLSRRRFYEQAYRGQIDERMLKAMGLEAQVFEGLVGEKLMELEARRLGIAVDDAAVARAIAADPTLQRDGKFIGREELKRLLSLQGISTDEFTEQQRQRLVLDRLRAIVSAGVAVSPAEAEEEFRRRSEQVKAEYVLVSAEPFRSTAVSDSDVLGRFEARKDHYAIPEKRVVSAIVVDPDALHAAITISESDINRYYQDNRADFVEPAEACASHILVRVRAEGAVEGHADADAKKIADDLLAKLQAGGDFAALTEIVRRTRVRRPDRGDMWLLPPGPDAARVRRRRFRVAGGEMSQVVKTSYGYHIIRMNSRKDEVVPALSAVKDRISQVLIGERAAAQAEEKQTAVLESLAKGRSLDDIAKAHGLSVQQSQPFARSDTPAAPLSSRALAVRAFDMKPGETDKEPFRVGRGTAFIALAQIQPARPAELKDVQAQVRTDIIEEKAFSAAQARALEVKAKAESGGLEKAATSLGLVRKETLELVSRSQPLGDLGTGAGVERAVFGLPQGSLSDPINTTSGYAVVRVSKRRASIPRRSKRRKAPSSHNSPRRSG